MRRGDRCEKRASRPGSPGGLGVTGCNQSYTPTYHRSNGDGEMIRGTSHISIIGVARTEPACSVCAKGWVGVGQSAVGESSVTNRGVGSGCALRAG